MTSIPLTFPAKQRAEVLPASLPPRGLARLQAAAYVGLSVRWFDNLVVQGRLPGPKAIDEIRIWDRLRLEGFRGAGYVYFIRAGHSGPIKIGRARNPEKRLASLQTGHSGELRLLGLLPGGPELERQMHERFAGHRIRGEWFRPVPEIRAFIEGACCLP